VLRIGLTGGIAAGKTEVARRFAHHGALVIDHDQLARDALAIGSPGLQRVVEEFGSDVLHDDGSLNRPALGRIVFGSPQDLRRLNEIVHPEVHRLSADAEDAARKDDSNAVVVHDIPLLVETGQENDFDVLIVVDAPVDVRVERLMTGRGMTEHDARSRIAAQINDDVRRQAADVVLDSSASLDELQQQVDEVWQEIGPETL